MLNRFRNIVKEENQIIVDSLEKRINAIESRQEQLEHRVEELERKLGRVPGNTGATSNNGTQFVPEFVEIKGFCSWKERLDKGATRADANELMKLLMPLLPHDLQPRVRPFELRGLRNYSIKIPVSSVVIREVKGIWSENLKAQRVTGPGQCELYVTLQKSPAQRAKYAEMGKLYEFLQSICKEKVSLKAFWAPEFSIYAEPKDAPPILVASLASDNSIVWGSCCQDTLGMSPGEANDALAVFRRK